MFSLLNIFDGKPDHPMSDAREARQLLADLPKDDAFKALEEITSWLASIRNAAGFQPESRLEIIMLLDETGQALHAGLLGPYLGAPHLQDFQGLHQWQGMHEFMCALSEAYAACIKEYQQAAKKPWHFKENLPVICVRLLRAIAGRMKLEMMRYVEIEQTTWDQLCGHYSFAEASQVAESMVYAYPKQIVHTNSQRELLRALILYISSPGTLAPDQIEVSYRITGRMAGFFELMMEQAPDCPHYIDLSRPGAPGDVSHELQITSTMRFFGAVKAVPKIKEIIDQNERNLIHQEQRFGNEFAPAGKLTVLKHLQMYWEKNQPHRHQARIDISTAIEVVHSFRTISQLIPSIDLSLVLNLSKEDAVALKEQSKVDLAAPEDIKYTTEIWTVSDASANGIGGIIPKTAGAWVKIGALCGFRSQNSQLWRVGMIRRLQTDSVNVVHVGIEILAKKPMSVWLRAIGQDTVKASDWDTGSGSFKYNYMPVILLPDVLNSYMNATMLMESGSYVPKTVCEMMMGEKSRDIKLVRLLDEGEDYEHVGFQWLAPHQV